MADNVQRCAGAWSFIEVITTIIKEENSKNFGRYTVNDVNVNFNERDSFS